MDVIQTSVPAFVRANVLNMVIQVKPILPRKNIHWNDEDPQPLRGSKMKNPVCACRVRGNNNAIGDNDIGSAILITANLA